MRPSATLLVWALMAAVSSAQSSQFVLSSRDRASMLAVDFIVTGDDGQLVTDLTASEVTIRVGGRQRTVAALDFIERPSSGHDTRPAPFAANVEPARTRSVIFVVDQDTIRPGRTDDIRDAVGAILQRMAPLDRAAMVTVPLGGLAVDLTTDRARVLQALGGLTAQSLRNEGTADAQCRTLHTLSAVRDLLLNLSQVEDPVSIVFFSAHQEAPQSIIRITGSAPVGGPCDLNATTFTALGHAAARARAQFFTIHADFEQRGRGLAGLEHVAGVTGGPLLNLATEGGHAVVERVIRQTAGYYVARVAREPNDSAGELLPVHLSVSRPATNAWRTPQLIVPRLPNAPSTTSSTNLLSSVIANPTVVRDLPLRVSGGVFGADAPGSVRVAVAFDSPDPDARLAEATLGLFNADGMLVSGLTMGADALASRPVLAGMDVPAGVYRLRVAGRDAAGRVGSVDAEISAQLTSIGPLSAGSILAGLSRGGAFVPMLEFGTEPTAYVLFEIYGPAAGGASAVIELADSAAGPARLTLPARVESSPGNNRAVPIQDLPAGDYVLRATVTPEGAASGRLMRTIRKRGVQALQ
jgi:hypothetical protein